MWKNYSKIRVRGKVRLERVVTGVLLVVSLAFVELFYWKWDSLVLSDLGRHITNGELVIKTGVVPNVNLYAYTYGDYALVTHHWLSGMIYYLIQSRIAFGGLGLWSAGFYVGVIGLALARAFKYRAGLIGLGWLMVLLPIVTYRFEMRPEQFSYLFLVIYLWVLSDYVRGRASWRWLAGLVVGQVLWVNLHIYFMLGILVTGWYGLLAWGDKEKRRVLAGLVAGLMVASLVNPFGLEGLVEPLSILDGVQLNHVVENVDVFELYEVSRNQNLIYFLGFLSVYGVGVVMAGKRQEWRRYRGEMWLLLGLGGLGLMMVRNITLFGYASLVLMPAWWGEVLDRKQRKLAGKFAVGLVTTGVVWGLGTRNNLYSPFSGDFLLGLAPGAEAAGQYLQQKREPGYIFNNYDIGGYLIYYLFPFERVFIDNRPEAYPADFFEKIYLPVFSDERIWLGLDEAYGFGTIVLSKSGQAEVMDGFVERRLASEKWVVEYEDWYALILDRVEK